MNKPAPEITGNEALAFFTAGYVMATRGGWEDFLRTLQGFKPACKAMYLAGCAAADNNALTNGAKALFRHQWRVCVASCRFMIEKNCVPVVLEGRLQFEPLKGEDVDSEGTA